MLKYPKGDMSGTYDCIRLSCASKASRALTGFLASSAHPLQARGRVVRRNRLRYVSNLSRFCISYYHLNSFSVYK